MTAAISNTDSKRVPAAEAVEIARDFIDALSDHCERICVAGSLRRHKPFVKDVELLFVPKFEPVIERRPPEDFFSAPPPPRLINKADIVIQSLFDAGLVAKRPNENGVK